MLQWCRLFKQCQNLPTGHCVTVVKADLAMSEPTYRALCYSGESCLSHVGVYLLGTVLQWCRLFKQYQNLPARHCVTMVKAVLAMSESTCRTLCYSDACCFKQCPNLPVGHCVTVVQTV